MLSMFRSTTKNLSMFCSSKDQIPTDQKANLMYRFTCPGCNEKYIGKTDRNIITRLHEHEKPYRSITTYSP